MLCCQQGGEITCQPGTSTLCGVPPLGDWLITNHLRGGFDSGAQGSNFGFQYQQIQKLQNEPSGTLFEKITSICIVARHPAQLHTCQAMHSGHAYGAVGRHERNPTCCVDAMCHCMHTDPISMAVDSLPNGDTPPQLGSSRTPHIFQSRSWTNPFGSILSLSGTTQITNNLILVMQQTPTSVGGQRETPATRHADQPSQATVPISAIIWPRQVPKCVVAGHCISHQVSHSGETTPNFNNQFDTRTPSRLPICVARLGVTSIILLSAYTFGVAQLVASLPLSNPTAPSRLGPCSHAARGMRSHLEPPPAFGDADTRRTRWSRQSRERDTIPVLRHLMMQIRSIYRFAKLCLWQAWVLEPRLGEADNPGPVGVSTPEDQCDLCHLTIVNITKLRWRQDEVLKLYSSKPGVVCCAETSSDTTMHCLFQKQARQRNLQYHPGAPCASSKIASQNTNVPYIGGVGMLCPHSSRMCPVIRSKAEWDSTRYTEAIVNFAGLQILGIALYLHTQDTSWELYRKDASDALQQRAIESVLEWDGHSRTEDG